MLDLPPLGLAEKDIGRLMSSFEFKGMVNGGYIIKGQFVDPNFNVLNRLIDSGYFLESRIRPIVATFQMRWGSKEIAKFPESATKEKQSAILLSLKAVDGGADKSELEFIAIDPPSWFLNMGDGSGRVYKGRVSEAIKQVVQEYAPGIKLDIGSTIDSKEGRWWMMRQDPKSFISSLFDWSASITQKKTQWIFTSDGFDLTIKEQAQLMSTQRGFYRYQEGQDHDTIHSWEFLADNALSVVQTKLITQGLSAVSGQYLDRITDEEEEKVFVKDSRTENKKIARIQQDQGFTKPPDAAPQQVGWSSVATIPEIYSAGDLGLPYDEYIDGRPRAMWLNLVNSLMRVKLRVVGHGEWSSSKGLGCDTVFVKWGAKRSTYEYKPFWWMTGNWLVYGFHHRMTRGFWWTDLYLARFDHDAMAKKVGFKPDVVL